ncbi:xanthine dehydrogenase small subunit [Hydrogenophaga sp.]|uniref:xanthine dehydrogenase small subunit n=1 Tax=Hydrogenophaga sp. TaxID=1904254 RepID=UPI0025BD1D39|nr:xanthine dehydrogenase small subunit [Hydrogenophaga sp.]
MSVQTLRFVRRGEPVTVHSVPADRTLLQVLREDLQLTAAKEGCGEGDCGACTVVIGEPTGGQLRYQAINSCIRLAHSVDGMVLWTAEDISGIVAPTLGAAASSMNKAIPALSSGLHPAQEAMVQCHGSQCGFCTPGFVMSLFALYQNTGGGQGVTRAQAQADLSGNLCRCTGYRPILDAAVAMGSLPLPAGCAVNEASTLAALKSIAPRQAEGAAYLRPRTLEALLQARARHPHAQVVAGCTDVGLWVTKQHRQFGQVLDVTATRELKRVETYPHHIAIGAAVTLEQAYTALVKERPQLQPFAKRFAGLPVRNSGTLGGNVANGSPIGDSMPLLIALGASVVLMRWDAKRQQVAHRELRLEDLYTGYRTNVMKADELLAWIKVPRPVVDEAMKVYKISKRFDDDISAVCLAIQMTCKNGLVKAVSIGAGGVAATPVRARQTEAALLGQPWTADTVMAAMATLRAEFQPISDMRASAHYRQTVLGNLLQRFWLESQGRTCINLESPATLEALA